MCSKVFHIAVMAAMCTCLSCFGDGGSGGSKQVCVAGLTQACLCVSGGEGVQVCKEDGTGWGECQACYGIIDTANQQPEKDVIEPEEDLVEPEEDVTEPEEDVVEPEEDVVEPEEDITEPEEDVTEPEEDLVEPEEGACVNDADMALITGSDVDYMVTMCGLNCLGKEPTCTMSCILEETGLSTECAECYDGSVACSISDCMMECATDPGSQACEDCQAEKCAEPFLECSGVPLLD